MIKLESKIYKTGDICHLLKRKEKQRSQNTREKKEEDAIVIRKINKIFILI